MSKQEKDDSSGTESSEEGTDDTESEDETAATEGTETSGTEESDETDSEEEDDDAVKKPAAAKPKQAAYDPGPAKPKQAAYDPGPAKPTAVSAVQSTPAPVSDSTPAPAPAKEAESPSPATSTPNRRRIHMTRLRAAMRSVGVAQRAAQKSRTDAAGGASPAAVPAAVPAASNQPAATMVEGSAPPTAAPLQAMAQPPPAAYMASPAVVPGSSNNFGKVLSSVGTGAAPTPVSYQYNVGQSQNKIGGAVTGKASSMLPPQTQALPIPTGPSPRELLLEQENGMLKAQAQNQASQRELALQQENSMLKAHAHAKEQENSELSAQVEQLTQALAAAQAKHEEHRSIAAQRDLTSVPLEKHQHLQERLSKKEEENMILHNGAAELQMLKLEMADLENLHQATEQAMQRQMSVLTVEKMKLAQKVGLLEAENAEQRQQWLNYHKQWGRPATVHN